MQKTIKKNWQKYLKAGVSLFFLYVLFKQVDWRKVVYYKNQIDIPVLLILLIGLLGNILISSYRWQIILESLHIKVSLLTLCRYYITGMFWNTFLPSTIGGDGYRMLAISRRKHAQGASAVISVLLDRLYGVAALFIFNFLLAFFYWQEIKSNALLLGIEGVLLALVLLGVFFLFFLSSQNQKIASWLKQYGWGRKLQELWEAMQIVPWRVSAKGISISMLFVFVSGLIWWGAYQMFVDISPGPTLFASVVANLSGILPISINGIGVSEGVAFYILNQWGVSADAVLGASIVIRSILAVMALIGGLVYLLDSPLE